MGTDREGFVFKTSREVLDCRDPGEKEPLMRDFFHIKVETISGNTIQHIKGLVRWELENLRSSIAKALKEKSLAPITRRVRVGVRETNFEFLCEVDQGYGEAEMFDRAAKVARSNMRDTGFMLAQTDYTKTEPDLWIDKAATKLRTEEGREVLLGDNVQIVESGGRLLFEPIELAGSGR